jgi:hypothetical protein
MYGYYDFMVKEIIMVIFLNMVESPWTLRAGSQFIGVLDFNF